VYGFDETSLEEAVVTLLQCQGKRLAVAESCTGGGLGARITAIPGTSEVFEGGFTTYSNRQKAAMLGVSESDLDQHGAVSETVAEQMASGARERTGADYALSITGIAGPDGGTELKPVGTVWIGLAGPDGVYAEHHRFLGVRRAVRSRSTQAALDHLRRELLKHE
jgi:nicotinamide-nucleotide amidase